MNTPAILEVEEVANLLADAAKFGMDDMKTNGPRAIRVHPLEATVTINARTLRILLILADAAVKMDETAQKALESARRDLHDISSARHAVNGARSLLSTITEK